MAAVGSATAFRRTGLWIFRAMGAQTGSSGGYSSEMRDWPHAAPLRL